MSARRSKNWRRSVPSTATMSDARDPEDVLSRPCECHHDECDAMFDVDPGMDSYVEVARYTLTDRTRWRFCSLACAAAAELAESVDEK